ncbi:hypothetical protein ACROYT_G032149 [Oculina patagonica]
MSVQLSATHEKNLLAYFPRLQILFLDRELALQEFPSQQLSDDLLLALRCIFRTGKPSLIGTLEGSYGSIDENQFQGLR